METLILRKMLVSYGIKLTLENLQKGLHVIFYH